MRGVIFDHKYMYVYMCSLHVVYVTEKINVNEAI